jgi:nitric oxide reductase large subunit
MKRGNGKDIWIVVSFLSFGIIIIPKEKETLSRFFHSSFFIL